jgi:hypothetical protein
MTKDQLLNVDARGIIRVGHGRGFVVEGADSRRLVITAAHCLPFFPPCHGASYLRERTYKTLLGPLGGEQSVSGAIAVLPDDLIEMVIIPE